MSNSVLDGLVLVSPIGRLILGTTVATLVLGVAANVFANRRYAKIAEDLSRSATNAGLFSHAVLNDVVNDAVAAGRRTDAPNVQAIIEDRFHSGLRSLLRLERFVKAATGLVIIFGLLGTFYGLTSSIGQLVHLVGADGGAGADTVEGVAGGLTDALSGMAVAFSNSLLGIASAAVLTLMGVFSNVTDRRVALMTAIETYLDKLLSEGVKEKTRMDAFEVSVDRLEDVIGRFEGALRSFASGTRDLSEFNAHLRDNVQRMSLSFTDLNDSLKAQALATPRRKTE